LRYRCPETMRSKNVHALGRLLGLDRLPEVKTLRRKIHQLAALDPAGEFMKKMAKARAEEAPQKPSVVLIDGHVQAYQTSHTTRKSPVSIF
ncbi:MAG: putative transposase, partial [Chloroflexota bacterium]